MCGISGIIDLGGRVNKGVLHAMTEVIRHRGPDDEGYLLWGKEMIARRAGEDTVPDCGVDVPLLEDDGCDYWMAFGHRRLSIIDLSAAGHQPMTDEEENLAITYNGEVYNYIEIREELESGGVIFKTGTDTEVILKAYARWGEKCVEHFNGMWAFAIYDRRKGKVFCSRDRLGAKPFYYFHKGNHFAFGSEIKQICKDPLLERRLNRQHLLADILLGIQDYSEETLIEDVLALKPGWNLVIDLDTERRNITRVNAYQYWELDVSHNSGDGRGWYDRIQNAVRLRLRSDAEIGMMISGGGGFLFFA